MYKLDTVEPGTEAFELSTSVDSSEILHQFCLVMYPITYRVLYIPGGEPAF